MEKKVIKLLILDVDGVLTDGKKYYGLDGMPFAKTFCDKDFTAIKRVRAGGTYVCFLSGDNKINENVANNRNIPFYYSRGKDKVEFIKVFMEKYNVTPEEICYIGDDLFDITIMKSVKYAYCTNDAPEKVKNECVVLNVAGGQNVVCYLADMLIKNKLINDSTMEEIEELDKNENF